MPAQSENNILLSVIIVTWNSEAEIEHCINSIIHHNVNIPVEIIVVDNASKDKTRSILKNYSVQTDFVKIILNDDNKGYTLANNQGINEARGEFVLLLNPDTKITDGALEKMIEFLLVSSNAGAIAPQLLNEDYTIQKSCRAFPTYWDMFCELLLLSKIFPMSNTFARWKMNYFSHNELAEVEQPMAAALMIKKSVLDKVQGFDERYKMFFNDVDLCKSIVDAGYKIYFYSDSKIFHIKGASIYKDRKNMLRVWNDDCIKYFKKHYNNFLLTPLLSLGLKLSLPFRK
ncbi:MAG: glycosyltransferase family 2 protein [Ignavibacteria bacterium]|nr:glycosyltransferase family 2 protein [Ignavibacteria bacterium]